MSSQHPPSQERTLTYGIEFEFMVAVVCEDCSPDPHPLDTRYTFPHATFTRNSTKVLAKEQAQSYVVGMLKDQGIPALSHIRYNVFDRNDEDSNGRVLKYLRSEAEMQGVITDAGQIMTHAFWMVSEDLGIKTIQNEDIAGYKFVAMEVASQILNEGDFSEVVKVYTLIQSNLRTQVNSSCGLHVHVGIEHLSENPENLKKLVTLLMILEEKGLFKQICAPHRKTSIWCKPVSRYSRAIMCGGDQSRDRTNNDLVAHVPQLYSGMETALRLALTRIWNCTTTGDIAAETLVFNDRYGFNADDTWDFRGGFAIRDDTEGPEIGGNTAAGETTIEFRYKESTGSATQDKHWLELCLRFVRVAEWQGGYYQALMRNLQWAEDLESCLTALGLEENEVRWWLGIAEHHRHHPTPPRLTQFLAPE